MQVVYISVVILIFCLIPGSVVVGGGYDATSFMTQE